MTLIEVQAPGMQTTVQDLGRPGFGHLGVSACGAADPLALRIGNRLLGNPDHAAALEMTLQGGRFLFRGAAWLALAGADFGATLMAVPSPCGPPFQPRPDNRSRSAAPNWERAATSASAAASTCPRSSAAVRPISPAASADSTAGR